MAKPIVLQINSLDAIERLIGGDSQVEIDVRAYVVQAFANKHLRSVAAEVMDTTTGRGIRDAVKTEVLETVNVGTNWRAEMRDVLRQPIQEAIKKQVGELVEQEIKEAVRQARLEMHKQMDERFKALADHVATQTQPQLAEDLINQLVVKRLNQMLNESK